MLHDVRDAASGGSPAQICARCLGTPGRFRCRLDGAEEHFLRTLRPFRTRIADLVRFRSRNFPCLWCQHHDECSVAGLYRDIGTAAYRLKITPDLFHRWEDHPETVDVLDAAVEKLNGILTEASGF